MRLRGIRAWLLEPVIPLRFILLVLCVVVGGLLGGAIYLGLKQIDLARDQRSALVARQDEQGRVINRLRRLEHPTKAAIRRLIFNVAGSLQGNSADARRARRELGRALRNAPEAIPVPGRGPPASPENGQRGSQGPEGPQGDPGVPGTSPAAPGVPQVPPTPVLPQLPVPTVPEPPPTPRVPQVPLLPSICALLPLLPVC